jgi:hypothetical protein
MAVKSTKLTVSKSKKAEEKPVVEVAAETVKPSWHKEETEEEGKLDPQEERVLDWILKAVVAFILGWLLLSILMVVGGYFGVWK